ncbi:hypothetical protein Pst134EB_033433 [Puccinia striiformis f. sp. tritici]|nr:hypothetical protein Pst134EB_033433 [Puccinia striiformis f. sp. tritici]
MQARFCYSLVLMVCCSNLSKIYCTPSFIHGDGIQSEYLDLELSLAGSGNPRKRPLEGHLPASEIPPRAVRKKQGSNDEALSSTGSDQVLTNEQPNFSDRFDPTAVITRQVDQAARPMKPHPGFNLFGAHITTSQPARPSDHQPSKDSDISDVPQSSYSPTQLVPHESRQLSIDGGGNIEFARYHQLIRQHYSAQILDWKPIEVNEAAAFTAYSMVPTFLKENPWNLEAEHIQMPWIVDHGTNGPYRRLREMPISQLILVPFIYRLVLKPLSEMHWRTINWVWNRFWKSTSITKTQAHFLRKFTWISDLIFESTIPELYMNDQLNAARSKGVVKNLCPPSDEGKLVRCLSMGKGHGSLRTRQLRAIDDLAQRFENHMLHASSLDSSTQTHLEQFVIDILSSTSNSILYPVYEFLRNVKIDEDTNKISDIIQFLKSCKDAHLSKNNPPKINQFPPAIQPILTQIKQRKFGMNDESDKLDKDTNKLPPAILLDNLLRNIKTAPLPINTLPLSIHKYFHINR